MTIPWNKGKKLTPQHRQNLLRANKKKTSCAECKIEMIVLESRLKAGRGKFCSQSCRSIHTHTGRKNSEATKIKMSVAQKGKKLSPEHIAKVRVAKIGVSLTEKHKKAIRDAHNRPEVRERQRRAKKGNKNLLGFKFSKESRKKMSDSHKGKNLGENNPSWIKDRSKLQRYSDDAKDRRSSAYNAWRRAVRLRDKHTCKIDNPDCSGRIEVHHILGWATHPELRYQVNNGITLCHAHHPRKRAEEKRLIPTFQELVSVSSK